MMRETSQKKAYIQIKKLISDHILAPGQHIAEHTIAEMIGMKRGPVRESLIQLHCEGVLSRLPHAGFVVRQLGVNDVRELYELREAIESSAAAMAASRWSPVLFEPIQEAYATMKALYEQEPLDIKRVVHCDERFHRAILAACGNQAFERAFKSLQFTSICLRTNKSYRQQDSVNNAKTIGEHKAILDAIEQRDCVLAERLMREHIHLARQGILSKMQEEDTTVVSDFFE